jgi:hypothetical protein
MNESRPQLSSADMNRLAELAEKLRDDALDDAEVAELDSLLAESAAARDAFANLALLDAELHYTLGGFNCLIPAGARRRGRKNRLFHRWTPLLIAACVALSAVALWRFAATRSTGHSLPIATISNASGADLVANQRVTTVTVGSVLRGGEFHLRRGLLELTYPSGVVILLESPARFDLRSTTTLWLGAGNAWATVPESAIGFTIETPSANIVDLGTEFGVSVGTKSSEVHVFKGEVIVKNPNEPDPLRLTENRASRIDQETRTPTGIDFQPERFMRTLDEPVSGYRELIREYDPLAYYVMHPSPDASELFDISAQKLSGQIVRGMNAGTSGPGKIGAGLRLGGPTARGYAVVPNFPLASSALTVCGWVRAESRPRWASIAKNWAKDRGINHGGQFHFGLWHDDGVLEVHVHNAAGEEVGVRDTVPLPIGEWQFVAFTFDGATLRLFREGREIGSTACAGISPIGPETLALGVKLGSSGDQPEIHTPGFWDGTIDELAVFHRALSPAQIMALYDAAH